jgi:hypothetical protein
MKWYSIYICMVLLLTFGAVQTVGADTVVELVNPIGGTEESPRGVTEIPALAAIAITAALGIMGSLALVAFVVGAFLWMTSGGSSDKIKQGTLVMVSAAIGMFIVFGAYAILSTVLNALTG